MLKEQSVAQQQLASPESQIYGISVSTPDLLDQNPHLTKSPKHALALFYLGTQLLTLESRLTQELIKHKGED